MKFKALEVLRAIRDDDQLTTSQKMLLTAAVLRTNKTGRVKASHEMLAQDAGLSLRHVIRLFKQPAMERYFVTDRHPRQVNHQWQGDMVSGCHGVTPSIDISNTSITHSSITSNSNIWGDTTSPSTDSDTMSPLGDTRSLSPEEKIRLADLESEAKLERVRLKLIAMSD